MALAYDYFDLSDPRDTLVALEACLADGEPAALGQIASVFSAELATLSLADPTPDVLDRLAFAREAVALMQSYGVEA